VGIALAMLAKQLHFTITVVDPLATMPDIPQADRILRVLDLASLPPVAPRYVVIASRGRFDEDALEQAVAMGTHYIALVSNKKRAEEMRQSLEAKGFSAEQLTKLRAPAGLDIGAETPEEIALSILADIVRDWRQHLAPSRKRAKLGSV